LQALTAAGGSLVDTASVYGDAEAVVGLKILREHLRH
jgi:diketogulonate reductase-like aldo/keto reductase